MTLSDDDLITKLNIGETDKVIDIGGSANQHSKIKIHTLADISRPEETPYSSSPLKASNFVKVDLNQPKLPFTNKEFDVCLCTHTLEDLDYPFFALNEMSRIAKRGYISTPSRGKDSEFTRFNLTDWLTGPRRVPGVGHHQWFFELLDNRLVVTPKNYPLLYTSEFQITKWLGEDECQLFWEHSFNFIQNDAIDFHLLIKNYREFMLNNRSKIVRGNVVFYLDNPLIMLKEGLKMILKRGEGFKHQ